MRRINNIVIHCTATPHNTRIESILNHWRNVLKWRNVGYHYIIESNGNIHQLASIESVTNGVAGHNANSIHIAYIGGVSSDDRTAAQKESMYFLIGMLWQQFPQARVCGHRDFSGVTKTCPQFNAITEFSRLKKLING